MVKYRKQTKYKFICNPDNLEIIIHLNPGAMATVCIKKFDDKKSSIFKKSYTLEEYSKKDLHNLVREFCEYFIGRYKFHSESDIKKAASELGSVYTILGLRIWKRKRIKE